MVLPLVVVHQETEEEEEVAELRKTTVEAVEVVEEPLLLPPDPVVPSMRSSPSMFPSN